MLSVNTAFPVFRKIVLGRRTCSKTTAKLKRVTVIFAATTNQSCFIFLINGHPPREQDGETIQRRLPVAHRHGPSFGNIR